MTNLVDPSSSAERIVDRYQLHELLGRGGMAAVYRATDLSSGREVALKRLTPAADSGGAANAAALFEREYQTLTQLRHPHVISVFDYGLHHDGSAYYTMELLDGGDLLSRAPVPWREACRLTFEVCSSLALLHSRRLLHRDISPRNIRCTRSGEAKLIDFGAMSPMSAGGGDVVGTPAFIAPEIVHRLALDARTDLFSLGATLYHALTGRPPYAARSFAEVLEAWRYAVPSPAVYDAQLPAALVELVLALIQLEPSLRPASAFEVMQRLAACAGLSASESEAVSRAYLVTPVLVGRGPSLGDLRARLQSARGSRGSGVLLAAPVGGGRSRLLDACALEAKTLGMRVLRATASGAREGFALASALIEHLLSALPLAAAQSEYPELFAAAEPGAPPAKRDFTDRALSAELVQETLCTVLARVARTQPLLIAVDDVQRCDPPSAAVLASLLGTARKQSVVIALTADSDAPDDDVLRVLGSRCAKLRLPPLTRDETQRLLESLFGDVTHLSMVADEIYAVARGNPRQSMDLAQALIDRGLIRYAAGTWTLPSRLSAEDLPASASDAARARLAALSAQARFLIEAHALAFDEELSDAQYHALAPEAGSAAVERALYELLSAQAIVQSGARYSLASRLWAAAARAPLTAAEVCARHAALAAMYRPRSTIAWIHHAFSAGLHEQGLDAMRQHHEHELVNYDHKLLLERNVGKMMWCASLAIETAQRLGRPPREIHEMRRWHFAGQTTREDGAYDASAALWLAQLVHDSGLDLYRADTSSTDPGARLMQALTRAHERHLATPEAERVYPVQDALRMLGEYVVYSIALGARTQDEQLLQSLPELLAPFVTLSPVLWALWNNAIATYQSSALGEYESARDLWKEVVEKLEPMRGGALHFIEPLINALVFGIGLMESRLGLATAAGWADRLDHDPYQRISALQLRTIMRLQQGDATGAEHHRRQGEVLALQSRSPQMFKTLLNVELILCTKALDLHGVQRLVEQMKPLAARHPGWATSLALAEASFHLVRGDLKTARQQFEACAAALPRDASGKPRNLVWWTGASAGLSESLFGLGLFAEARDVAAAALARCHGKQIGDQFSDLKCTLALAQAKLGEPGAAERLDALLAEQTRLGVSGLRLGLVHEARAMVAIWTGDSAGFAQHAEQTARAYRHGARSSLAARYARLMHEAAGFGLRSDASLSDFQSVAAVSGMDYVTSACRSLASMPRSQERGTFALNVICDTHAAEAGHLLLVSDAGLYVSCSRASEPPSRALLDAANAQLASERARAADLDDMITGDLDEEGAPRVEVDGRSYRLLLLRCTQGDSSLIAGIAALVNPEPVPQQPLLQALAAELVRAGDSLGLQLS